MARKSARLDKADKLRGARADMPAHDIAGDELSSKHRRFVEEYLIDLNGTAAAKRAGYAENSAHVTASRLLANPKIQEAIAAAKKARSERVQLTQDRVLQELAAIAFLDPRRLFDEAGNLLPIGRLPDEVAAAVAGLDIEELFEGRGEDRRHVGRIKRIKLVDKRGALELAMRHLGMLREQVDVRHLTPPSFKVYLHPDVVQETQQDKHVP